MGKDEGLGIQAPDEVESIFVKTIDCVWSKRQGDHTSQEGHLRESDAQQPLRKVTARGESVLKRALVH